IWFLRKTISTINPDAILSFGELWNNLVLLAGWGKNWPTYISDRCQPNKRLGVIHEILRKWLYPHAYGIIAQTTQAKQEYQKKNLNNTIEVIGNPIHPVNPVVNYDKREKIVLCVGRLIKSKHHSELVNLFAEIDN